VFDLCVACDSHSEFIYEICGKSADNLSVLVFLKIALRNFLPFVRRYSVSNPLSDGQTFVTYIILELDRENWRHFEFLLKLIPVMGVSVEDLNTLLGVFGDHRPTGLLIVQVKMTILNQI